MTMDITKSVAFTGHRSERIFQVRMLYLYLDIVSQVKRLYSLGYRYFLSGMAEGFDLLAAQAVADLKMKYTDIRLIAVGAVPPAVRQIPPGEQVLIRPDNENCR